jgi:predicted GNAT family acetyltransferase
MLQLLVTDLTSLYGHDVPTVSGEKAISRAFARAWTLQTHQPHALLMGQRIYQLDAVIPPKDVTGNLRQATEADREHLIDWVIAFSAITPQGEMTRPHAAAQIDRYLGVTGDVSGVFVWEVDGMPVSMAASVRPTENGSCVGMVYTPPEFRRKGYASAVTAGVSQHILNSGKRFACLYTDLGNPTSNHIYQEIGYYPVLDVDMYSLNDNT